MEVVAYATENYRHISEIFRKSIPFEYTLKTDSDKDCYIDCIQSKFEHLLNFKPKSEFIISSDVDVVFFNSKKYWKKLGEHMRNSQSCIFFMKDAVQTNLNAGFFIAKRDYFESEFKQFLKKMLDDGLFRTMKPHYEQTYMNIHLKNWDFIPDEYVYKPNKITNLAQVLFYHAICTKDKLRSMQLAEVSKKYQVYVCFHDDSTALVTQNILYRHPWMTPFKLNSTKYFESEFFATVEVDPSAKYIGMFTYSILEKHQKIFKTNILKILEESNEDVITFNFQPEKIKNTNKDHPKFCEIWIRLVNKLLPDCGENPLCDSIMLFFNNFWVAKPHIVKEYQEFLKKAMVFLEEDPFVYEDACYVSGTLSKNRLFEINGTGNYTYHPFVLERLPCLFFWYKKLTIKVNK